MEGRQVDGRRSPRMLERRAETIRARGRAAGAAGTPATECPYAGWQGGYRHLWLEGWAEGSGQALPEGLARRGRRAPR